MTDAARFLGALVAPLDDGFIELRTIVAGSRARQEFVPVAEVERAAERAIELAQRGDVYVSAIPRVRERGRAADVGPATAAWCDLDSPEALAALDTFALSPSFVIATSEGKAHAWWLLAEPGDAAEVVALNRDLAHALGGDIASTDAARILRVPGTLNHKFDPPYRVELTQAGEERRPFAELRAAVPVHDEHGPATTPATDVSGSLAERIREYQQMTAGDGRNVAAASIFGSLLRRDGQAAAERIFRSINAAALDPLPEAEVAKLLRSIGRAEAQKHDERRITTRPLSEYKIVPVDWLWRGYVPASELTMLAGDGGTAKSTLCAALAAGVTCGKLTGLVGTSRVLVVLGEDDPARVSRARHQAAGAVMEHVYILAANEGAGEEPITLPDDLDLLREAIDRLCPELVVIDPLAVHLAGSIDYFRDGGKGGMRAVLNPLARMAQTTGVTVIVVVHLNKGTGAASSRIGGTAAIRNAARNVLMLVRHPEAIGDDGADDGRRILGHDKCNYGAVQPSLAARVHAVPILKADGTPLFDKDGQEATTSLLTIGEVSDVGYEDALRAASAGPSDDASALSEAIEFVKTELAAGAMPSRRLVAGAKAAGVSARTLERARKQLGVRARKEGDVWLVALPTHDFAADQVQLESEEAPT